MLGVVAPTVPLSGPDSGPLAPADTPDIVTPVIVALPAHIPKDPTVILDPAVILFE